MTKKKANNGMPLIKRKPAEPSMKTTVNLSPKLYRLSREHGIRFSDAIRAGISLMLAERGVQDYDNRLNLWRRLENTRKRFEQTWKELNYLKEEIEFKNRQIDKERGTAK